MKKCRRWLAALMTLLMLMMISSAPTAYAGTADTAAFPHTVEYIGGVVESGWLEGAVQSRAATLDVAYVVCSDAFLTVGEESTWTFVAQGGAAPYSYQYMMYWQDFSNTTTSYECVWGEPLTGAQLTWAPDREGRYFLYIYVFDADGQYLVYQSQMYETAASDDYADENTVAGKVEQIVADEIRSGMSDYAKALALHDWLIYNANYDYSVSPYYTPDGVLLYGRGVCQSYALAYQMLLKKAGVESLYVTGMAGGGSHAWNLVKMGGEWYHVDCTWDDPLSGGMECHDYFGLTDALIARDHVWNLDGETNVPDCTATRYTHAINAADVVYSDISQLNELVAALPEGLRTIDFYYIGTQTDMSAAFKAWLNEAPWEIFGEDVETISATWSPLTATLTLTRSCDAVVISPRALTLDVGESWTIDTEIYSETGEVTWASSDTGVVRVNQNGQATGVGAGTATITATLSGTDIQAGCTVNVQEATEAMTYIVDPDGVLVAYLGAEMRIHKMPDAICVIGAGAFENCTSLKGVNVGSGVTRVEAGAFDGCTSLTAMALPASVDSIEDGAMPAGLEAVYVCAGSAGEAWAQGAGVTAYRMDGGAQNSYALPVSLAVIEECAFLDSDPTSVQIESGCASIGEKAFAQCELLRDVTIPESVTQIAADAFEDSLLLVIHAPQGSAAHAYALEQGFGWAAE